jgi:hypothetical protein
MTRSAIGEYVAAARPRYRAQKGRILDEFCQTTGMHREAAAVPEAGSRPEGGAARPAKALRPGTAGGDGQALGSGRQALRQTPQSNHPAVSTGARTLR